jgi:DNA-binding LacI/PurR family transcriptional regulator
MARKLLPVAPEPGRPLYLSVRDTLQAAIDAGIFQPGEQMPSTKDLSEQMQVSLVTAHRALQELVTGGVLQRSQGKGTFIHERYPQRREHLSTCRIGLMIHAEASIADFFHSQVIEGLRREADRLNVDIILLRFGEDMRNECNGYLYLNPLPDELAAIESITRRQPTMVIGARTASPRVGSVDVDNVELARQAVSHLVSQGRRRLMIVGGTDLLSNSRDRKAGFVEACRGHGLGLTGDSIITAASWRLTDDERARLEGIFRDIKEPIGVFGAGYYMALDVYTAARNAGKRIPDDIAVVGVDDPPSAGHLSPGLSTMRQPLVQLGQSAIAALVDLVRRPTRPAMAHTLFAELIERESTSCRT